MFPWIDVVMSLQNPFDYNVAVAACSAAGITLSFERPAYANIVGNVAVKMADGMSAQDAYISVLSDWNPQFDAAKFEARQNPAQTASCCGGSEPK